MNRQAVNRVSGRLVLGLSLFAMFLVGGATVLAMLGRWSPSPGGDEGAAAHVFQLAIVLLVLAGSTFLATADWQRPREVARRLVVPASALIVAFAMLYNLEHLR